MTPAELRVIETARAWSAATGEDHALATAVFDAVQALEAERKAGAEMTIPWGKVVESDHIWSDRTRRWYEVTTTVDLGDGNVRVWAKKLPPIKREAGLPVKVRRGAAGQVVDLVTVLWSGQSIPNTPETIESEES